MITKCPRVNVWTILKQRIPILTWFPKYRFMDAISDLVAGITVGLTLMPQAIAYAALAGLGPQYGLYSSFAGSLVYIIFGTVKEVNIGPTAIISLLTYNYTRDTNPDFAVLLCFLSGIVELLSGILHLGFLVEFVSIPVTAGFTSAAAVIIASSQVKGLLGIKFDSENFVETWTQIVRRLSETRPWDLTLSIVCCGILLAMRTLKDYKIKNDTKFQRYAKQMTWLISTARNAAIVVVCAALAYYFTLNSETPFILTGRIDPGLPQPSIPPFSTTVGNQTYDFVDMCSHLGSGIVIVPLISLLGNVAIAKAFANGNIVDATQEMMTLGLCNVIGSFFRSMPVSGSFSRSAVNNASGVQTPLGGLYTGGLVILALGLLTPYFYYIPRATLASVIVCAVLFMVEIKLMATMWKTKKKDLAPALATFAACLWFGVEIGILIGLIVDLIFLLFYCARPKCKVEKISTSYLKEYVKITPSSGLLFPTVDYVRTEVSKAVQNSNGPVVIDCSHISALDFTGIQGIKSLINDMKKKDRHVIFHTVQPEINKILLTNIGKDFLCSSSESALTQILKGFENASGTLPCLNDMSEVRIELEDLKERGNNLAEPQTNHKCEP